MLSLPVFDDDDMDDPAMTWPEPTFSRSKVDSAGKAILNGAIVRGPQIGEVLDTIFDWRMAHSYPMNAFHRALKRKAVSADPEAVVVQRLKRFPSIHDKLMRSPTRLSQMQDIAGCRAIVCSLAALEAIKQSFFDGRLGHQLDHIDDYIASPRDSGYRGVHLIYRYAPKGVATSPYKGMKVELQLRTQAQHAWATAVETVGTFTGQALKSSQGVGDYLRLFALMASVQAMFEGTTPTPGTPDDVDNLIAEIRHIDNKVNFRQRFFAYGNLLEPIFNVSLDSSYYLLDLDSDSMSVDVVGYKSGEINQAMTRYSELEAQVRENPSDTRQVVLVLASSLAALKSAYPNYFLDTRAFNAALDHVLS
jgi:hypothetical protein